MPGCREQVDAIRLHVDRHVPDGLGRVDDQRHGPLARDLPDLPDRLNRPGNVAARAAFSELITKYPRSDLVPDAMFFMAQAFAAERNNAAADQEYAALISRFPNSPRVPIPMAIRFILQRTDR